MLKLRDGETWGDQKGRKVIHSTHHGDNSRDHLEQTGKFRGLVRTPGMCDVDFGGDMCASVKMKDLRWDGELYVGDGYSLNHISLRDYQFSQDDLGKFLRFHEHEVVIVGIQAHINGSNMQMEYQLNLMHAGSGEKFDVYSNHPDLDWPDKHDKEVEEELNSDELILAAAKTMWYYTYCKLHKIKKIEPDVVESLWDLGKSNRDFYIELTKKVLSKAIGE